MAYARVTMALAIVPPPRLVPEPETPLARVRDLARTLAKTDGHSSLIFPDLCVYRYSERTTIRKAATLGVTLGVALQGQKQVSIGGSEITLDQSRLLVITREREQLTAVMSAGPERPYLGMCVCFQPERVARALVALAEAGGKPTTERLPAFTLAPDAGIAGALERLLASVADPLDAKLFAPLAIEELLFRLLRSDAAATVRNGVGHASDGRRILETMQFIRDHHGEKLSVERLARRAAMSPSHFAHRFSAVARVSPMRFLREVRLDRARELLFEDGARVSEVALEVGFESPAHFTREFKRRFGFAPSKSLARLRAS
jgi:AraC-like DNA-binding protein